MTTLITCDDGKGNREILLTEIPSFLPKAVLTNTSISNVTKDEEPANTEEPTPPSALFERTL